MTKFKYVFKVRNTTLYAEILKSYIDFFKRMHRKFKFVITSSFHKIASKFGIHKALKFILCMKYAHYMVHVFFTGIRQKLEWNIVFYFFIMYQIELKFWYNFKPRTVTMYTKTCIVNRSVRNTWKVWTSLSKGPFSFVIG